MTKLKAVCRGIGFTICYVYALGVPFSATYYNWRLAHDEGFGSWVMFGEVRATLHALIWPWDVVHRAPAKPSAPKSVTAFYRLLDMRNEKSGGDTPDAKRAAVLAMIARAATTAAEIDRAELNEIYPGWGDHVADDLAAGFAQVGKAATGMEQDSLDAGIAADFRWQEWWNAHRIEVMQRLGELYAE